MTSNTSSFQQVASSMITFKNKEYYDFIYESDILCSGNGVAGLTFRVMDQFNYYAFIVDKIRGIKAIIKVQNGKEKILASITDGGILINDWHKVIISVKTSNISVLVYDTEQAQGNTEKKLRVQDYTFVKGTVGYFVNKMSGFYFDKVNVTPLLCWTPWQPKPNITIINTNANYYNEDFRGSLEVKYKINDAKNIIDGPSVWEFRNQDDSLLHGLELKTQAYDSSPAKKPCMALQRECQFANGSMRIKFIPNKIGGTVSIIFKYKTSVNANGETLESFYSFDINNSVSGGQWSLRRFLNDEVKELMTVSTRVPGLNHIGYSPERTNEVVIDNINEFITVKMSQEQSGLREIMTVRDDSLNHGGCGVGSSKSSALFTIIEVTPPSLKLTESDIDFMLNSDSKKIEIPSVVEIKKLAEKNLTHLSSEAKASIGIGYFGGAAGSLVSGSESRLATGEESVSIQGKTGEYISGSSEGSYTGSIHSSTSGSNSGSILGSSSISSASDSSIGSALKLSGSSASNLLFHSNSSKVSYTATTILNNMISLIKSSTGRILINSSKNSFTGSSSTSSSSSSSSSILSSSFANISQFESSGWTVCIETRTVTQRNQTCNKMFEIDVKKQQCKVIIKFKIV